MQGGVLLELNYFEMGQSFIVKAGGDFLSLGAVQGLIEADEMMERFGYNQHEGKPKGQYQHIIFWSV